MINRKEDADRVQQLFDIFPIVAILGARQVGKSTLAKQLLFDHYFDLENPEDKNQLEKASLLFPQLQGRIVIDEVQRMPDLFPLLRYTVDNRNNIEFLLLGSASPSLVSQSSESLAGRIGYLHLGGFSLQEVDNQYLDLWVKGSFPKSYLLNEKSSIIWRENFISTFLERDIPQLGIKISSPTMRRFWLMISHYHSQLINYSELSRSFGVSDMTIRRYLEILEGTFMIRLIYPWHNNTSKRLVKSPKLYIVDSGLFHALNKVENFQQLLAHPKYGASWEGFVIEQIIRMLGLKSQDMFFWATHSGAEVDLYFNYSGKKVCIEIKATDTPKITKSLMSAKDELEPDITLVVHQGEKTYPLSEDITALSVLQLVNLKQILSGS